MRCTACRGWKNWIGARTNDSDGAYELGAYSYEGVITLAATNWCVEELVRAGRLRFLVVGKYRVIDVRDLDDWIEVEKGRQAAVGRFQSAA